MEEDEGLWEAERVAGVGAEVERGGGGGVGAVHVDVGLGEEVGVHRGGAETIIKQVFSLKNPFVA